jgi:hypothetical protein
LPNGTDDQHQQWQANHIGHQDNRNPIMQHIIRRRLNDDFMEIANSAYSFYS